MTDIVSTAKRSKMMSRIRSHGNKGTELEMIRVFRRHGITGWRRHQPIFGKPDFVFRQLKLAVFMDGCFWHGCPKHSNMPATNREFWRKKLETNKRRDRLVTRTLRASGWRVLRVWEHELTKKNETTLLRRIRRALEA